MLKKMKAPCNIKEDPFFGYELDEEQKAFRDSIWSDDKQIVFANAVAGTGKTMIAVGTGMMLVEYEGKGYDGIVYIAAPTQEQKQGYLKGSLEEKSEPYFEPCYQAIVSLKSKVETLVMSDVYDQKGGSGYIRCVTHTFLRGTNFENKVVIIDEAQNFYLDELKKVLTRIHDSCKVIVIGHSGQIDLFEHPERSGFQKYIEHFKKYDRCAVCNLTKNYRGWISSVADTI